MQKIKTTLHGKKTEEQLKIVGDTVNSLINKIKDLENQIKDIKKKLNII